MNNIIAKMGGKAVKIIRRVRDKILKRNPIKYARKIGVSIGDNCRLTGNPGWGSEPWLIKIGNHVLLSSEVRFITHDAGTFLLENLVDIKMYLNLVQY